MSSKSSCSRDKKNRTLRWLVPLYLLTNSPWYPTDWHCYVDCWQRFGNHYSSVAVARLSCTDSRTFPWKRLHRVTFWDVYASRTTNVNSHRECNCRGHVSVVAVDSVLLMIYESKIKISKSKKKISSVVSPENSFSRHHVQFGITNRSLQMAWFGNIRWTFSWYFIAIEWIGCPWAGRWTSFHFECR